jgi:hypothetical protein
MKIYDYLVVGSGCSGAMAAQTLVERGAEVAMLDAGITNEQAAPIPDKDFLTIRKTEAEQYRYFIGDNAEGVVWGDIGKGAQVTPPRQHMGRMVSKYLPVESKTFLPLESLGYGGLGIGWGLQCWEYSDSDLRRVGLDPKRTSQAYETIANRIGISATKDDAAEYTIGKLRDFQPSPKMDRNSRKIYSKYLSKRNYLHKRGIFIGRTPLALLTKDFKGRKKYSYKDMDFYSDNEQSAWRPWISVNSLKKDPHFTYIGGYLVRSFIEKSDHVEVHCLSIKDDTPRVFLCRTLILGTGALGSARIVLRSLGKEDTRLQLISCPYTYLSCIQPSLLGKAAESKMVGLAQLSLFLDETKTNSDVTVASIYSYQSLMLFRLIRQMPFGFKDAKTILRYLSSGLLIVGVHHPDTPTQNKYLKLVKNSKSPTEDQLHISYTLDSAERSQHFRREKTIARRLRKLGVYSLKRVEPGYGSSVHYAGTVPFSESEKPYTLSPSGKLRGTKNVYIADSSGFNYLPAGGLTFTLMANAHMTAENALNDR